MVLHPLEFSECFLDSPWFRQSIQQYEDELETTNTQIKQLIKDAKNMLNASRQQGKMMNYFNDRLQKFQFDCIGENLTDNEKGIAGSLKEFGLMLEEVATDWSSTIERSELQLIKPLEDFRKEHIHGYRNAKKSFDKASERYYKQLEHTLGLSHKKKGQHLQESDNELHAHKKIFHKEALNYVYKLQEVQERKKFEFVEHLLMFMQVYFNFFHQSHETANDCKDYMKDLQMRLVSTREQYEGAREKTKTLMRKMSDHPEAAEDSAGSGMRWSRVGYLFLNEKNPIMVQPCFRFTSKWTKYFCMYTKENKLFQMLTPYHQPTSAISLNQSTSSSFVEPMIVKTCTRRVTDSIDKRFCFDLEVESGKRSLLTFQAVSDLDRRKWMSVMDGREPEYIPTKLDLKKMEGQFKLDENGFRVIEKVIAEIERRGVEHEGIYRLVGVLSKVDFLLQQAVNPATCDSVDFSNESEWEINTLTSALKSAFRNLPEPILTFELHRDFINAAKLDNHNDRVTKIRELIEKLPKPNQRVLSLLAPHLRRVQSHSEQNKMTIQNLGVCFGPTLMRDKQESVQSIMELKFSNIIVEILIEFMFLEEEEVFDETPQKVFGKLSPLDMQINIDDLTPSSERSFASGVKEKAASDANGPSAPLKSEDEEVIEKEIPGTRLRPGRPKISPKSPRLLERNTYTQGVTKEANASTNQLSPPETQGTQKKVVAKQRVTSLLRRKPAKRPPRLSDSTDNKESLPTQSPNTRPKSAFIPSAFLVEETENLNHQEAPSEPTVPNSQSTEEDESTSPGKTPTSPGKTPTTPSFLWGANDGPTSRPRSSAVVKSRGSRSPTEEVTPTVARTLFSCAGEHPEELSFQPGMLIREVERTEEPGWLRGMLNGKVGLVPENYIEFIG
uniref:Rho GTPase-activating protein 10 n=1 Tax=Ciona savignyi TaxID=51511 RepID=H2ZLM1_CIOSA